MVQKIQRYAVIGTGAVGGYYGALLRQKGYDVYFLARSDFQYIREHGIRIDRDDGALCIPDVSVHDTISSMPRCDVVIFTVKSTQIDPFLPKLSQLLTEKGVVIVMQNGLGIEEQVAGYIGRDRVIGSLCFIAANKTGPGTIRHLAYGSLSMGCMADGEASSSAHTLLPGIVDEFTDAGIDVSVVDNLLLARWKKMVWNIPFNGLSVLLRATTQELMDNLPVRYLIRELMEEVCRCAAICGSSIPDSFVDKMMADTDTMPPYLTSMRLDFDNGRPMELAAIYGNPLQAVTERGGTAPRIDMLYRLLLHIDDARRSQQG